jgi:MFS transporter, PPP family, 3-phenylpropionic acid transporter
LRRASIAYVIVFVAVAAWAPYLSAYYQSIGISLGEIGLLLAMTSAVSLISAPIWGLLHDRYPKSFVLLPLAAGIGALGTVGLATVGNSPWLVPSAAGFAIGAAGLSPMMDVRVLELARADRTRYARVRVCGSISFIVAAPLIGVLADANGLRAIFLAMIPALLIGGLAATTLPGRSMSVRAPSLMRAPGTVLRHRPIALFLIGALVGWTAVSAQSSFFTIYLRSLGAPNDLVGWAWSMGAIFEVPTMFFFPYLARRFGVERLIVAGAVVLVVRQVANVVFTDPELLIVFSLFQGVGYALMLIGGVTFVSRQAPLGTAATAQGIFTGVTSSLSAILGSGLGGQVAGFITIRGLFAVSAVTSIAAVVLIALAVLPVEGRSSEPAPPARI